MNLEVIHTGQTVTVGRQGMSAELVTVGGEPFVVRGGKFYSECGACDGGHSGTKRHFGHVFSGVCFDCDGAGYRKVYADEAAAIRLVRNRINARNRAARKEAARIAAQDAARDAWAAANPEVAAALAEVMADAPAQDAAYVAFDAWTSRWSDFVTSLANQAQFRPLSEKQTAAVLPAIAKVKAARAAAETTAAKQRYADATLGEKVTVTGTVAVAMTIETQYGYARLVIVEGTDADDGITVKMFGTSKALYSTEKGQHVEVTGTVKDFEDYQGVPQTVVKLPKINILTDAK